MPLALDMGRCRPSNVLTILAVRFLKTKTSSCWSGRNSQFRRWTCSTRRGLSSANTILLAAVSSPACRQSMQTKAIGPSRHRSAAGEGLFQKGRELCRGHLSDAHREFPVANAARATDVDIDGNVVGGSVKIRSARSSPRSASYASLSRASPQTRR